LVSSALALPPNSSCSERPSSPIWAKNEPLPCTSERQEEELLLPKTVNSVFWKSVSVLASTLATALVTAHTSIDRSSTGTK